MEYITLAHGSGGRLSRHLIESLIAKHLGNPYLDQMNDAAILPSQHKIALTTDSFVISPLFFRGGDIGKLAVCGTVNDLTVSGAIPEYLTLALILEEGLAIADLERIIVSIAATARQARVRIVCGDTKVVERGNADKIYINTAGIGFLRTDVPVSPAQVKPGDVILINGTIGDHGIAVLADREGLEFETPVCSDCAPLNILVDQFFGPGVKCMRDPTRGGVGTILNEIARQADVGMILYEESLPVHPAVVGACDMLGLELLHLANEGKVLVIASPESADEILARMRGHELGRQAAKIGVVRAEDAGRVVMQTALSAKRIVGMLEGEHLPRIC
ncbi:MAG: hydrogenase expression/formation protein HypE [Peptococcaceae bacterium]|jgi:hydrogenase expression/formation protein HypE|nr:hydrogenase expression/formation protein HypE [Peptococcaceae bacterium]